MAKDKSSGCIVAVAIVAVLFVLLVLPLSLWFVRGKSSVTEAARAKGRIYVSESPVAREISRSGDGAVVLSRGELSTFTLPKPGEEITREVFMAFMTAPDTTELTKETFRRIASEATVSWLLRTENVSERNGVLRGSFQIPWEIREGSGSTSSSIIVQAEFTEDSRDDLLRLRINDWVTVKGDLRFAGNSPVLKNATLAPSGDRLVH